MTNQPNCTGCFIGGGNERRTDKGHATHQLSRYPHTTNDSWEEKLGEILQTLMEAGEKCIPDDDEWNLNAAAIYQLFHTEREAARHEGQMNPNVGFLRQYINESSYWKGDLWEDEDLLRFLRIGLQTPTDDNH